jgi:hypothetical protein
MPQIKGTFVENKLKVLRNQSTKDVIKVMKNGQLTKVDINNERNECKVQSIEYILNRNRCSVVFKDFKEVMAMANDEDDTKPDEITYIKKKFNDSIRQQTLIKLQMCTKLLSVHGLVFLRAMLKRIELEKAKYVS